MSPAQGFKDAGIEAAVSLQDLVDVGASSNFIQAVKDSDFPQAVKVGNVALADKLLPQPFAGEAGLTGARGRIIKGLSIATF